MYRFNGKQALVQRRPNYDEALVSAQNAFHSLSVASPENIAFFVTRQPRELSEKPQKIRIPRAAWSQMVPRLESGEVVDVVEKAPPRIYRPDPGIEQLPDFTHDPPPEYTPAPMRGSSTKLITYRFEEELVYMPRTTDYISALAFAREAFPSLRHVRTGDIDFQIKPSMSSEFIHIVDEAWADFATQLQNYAVVDITVESADNPTSESSAVYSPEARTTDNPHRTRDNAHAHPSSRTSKPRVGPLKRCINWLRNLF